VLEEVKERRTGVESQDFEQARRRKPRGPGREDLVEPERPIDQEEEPSDERRGDGGAREDGRKARPAWRFRFDALS
jgi:hypothetical protein